MADQVVSLSQAASGCVFRVVDIHSDCVDSDRLKSMGICVGRQLSLVQSGDPLIVSVIGARVGISARLAESVSVVLTYEPEEKEAHA